MSPPAPRPRVAGSGVGWQSEAVGCRVNYCPTQRTNADKMFSHDHAPSQTMAICGVLSTVRFCPPASLTRAAHSSRSAALLHRTVFVRVAARALSALTSISPPPHRFRPRSTFSGWRVVMVAMVFGTQGRACSTASCLRWPASKE